MFAGVMFVCCILAVLITPVGQYDGPTAPPAACEDVQPSPTITFDSAGSTLSPYSLSSSSASKSMPLSYPTSSSVPVSPTTLPRTVPQEPKSVEVWHIVLILFAILFAIIIVICCWCWKKYPRQDGDSHGQHLHRRWQSILSKIRGNSTRGSRDIPREEPMEESQENNGSEVLSSIALRSRMRTPRQPSHTRRSEEDYSRLDIPDGPQHCIDEYGPPSCHTNTSENCSEEGVPGLSSRLKVCPAGSYSGMLPRSTVHALSASSAAPIEGGEQEECDPRQCTEGDYETVQMVREGDGTVQN